MAIVFSPVWGPYGGVADARDHLCRFVDKACTPGVGVVWAANGAIYPLRAPHRDGAGFGDVLVFEWTGLPPATPRPPSTTGERIRTFIDGALADLDRSFKASANAQMAMNQSVNKAVGRILAKHSDDGVGVALDVLCVVLSLALLPTGLGALGFIALAGGSVLLIADGGAYALEMTGNEAVAEEFKRKTECVRIVATIATLPDAAFGGYKAVRELAEIRNLRAADRATTAVATKLGAQTASASRANRYAQIVERANLRAQIRGQQISALLRLELTPRAGAVASLSLLMREESSSNDSAARKFLSGLRIHATASHN